MTRHLAAHRVTVLRCLNNNNNNNNSSNNNGSNIRCWRILIFLSKQEIYNIMNSQDLQASFSKQMTRCSYTNFQETLCNSAIVS